MKPGDSRDDFEDRLLVAMRRDIPDDGFSSRLGARLPPARRPRDWTLPLVAAGALAGCAIATFLVPVGPALLEGLLDLAAARALTPAALGTLAALGALAATGAVMAADT